MTRRIYNFPKVLVTSDPFKLPSKDAIMMARYLVEDSKQHRIPFEFKSCINFDIFKSILKTLFKNFVSYTMEEFLSIFNQLKEVINPKKVPIVDTFFKLYDIRGNYCDYQQLQNNFQSNEINLNPKEMNVIILGLYRESKNLNHLNYNILFE